MDERLTEKPIIGVDLGGTKVSAGRVENGRLTGEATAPIDAAASDAGSPRGRRADDRARLHP